MGGGREGRGGSGLIIVLARTERAGLPWSWGHQLSFKVMVDAPRPGEAGAGCGEKGEGEEYKEDYGE